MKNRVSHMSLSRPLKAPQSPLALSGRRMAFAVAATLSAVSFLPGSVNTAHAALMDFSALPNNSCSGEVALSGPFTDPNGVQVASQNGNLFSVCDNQPHFDGDGVFVAAGDALQVTIPGFYFDFNRIKLASLFQGGIESQPINFVIEQLDGTSTSFTRNVLKNLGAQFLQMAFADVVKVTIQQGNFNPFVEFLDMKYGNLVALPQDPPEEDPPVNNVPTPGTGGLVLAGLSAFGMIQRRRGLSL